MPDKVYEVFEDPEVLELREIEVDSVGLVPSGANQRKYIIMKGGDDKVDANKIAEAIMADEHFWDKLASAFADSDTEKAGKEEARRQMAMRILGASTVEEAIRALGGESKAEDKKPEDEEKKAAAPDYEEEDKKTSEEAKATAPDDEEDKKPEDEKKAKAPDGEEEYPKPSAKSEFAEIFAGMQERIDASEAMAKSALAQLQAAKQESRKRELVAQAEKFAALPEVKPNEFADVLYQLEQASPELYTAIVAVLEPTANAMTEVFGEIGSRQSDGTGIAFLDRVEGRTKELQAKKTDATYEEAYSDAFDQIAAEEPGLAQAYLDRVDR